MSMQIDIHHIFHNHEQSELHTILNGIQTLITQGNNIMATVQELNDGFTELATTIANEKTEVATNLTALTDEVAALKDMIAQGGTIKESDLDPIMASLTAAKTQVEAITVPVAPV